MRRIRCIRHAYSRVAEPPPAPRICSPLTQVMLVICALQGARGGLPRKEEIVTVSSAIDLASPAGAQSNQDRGRFEAEALPYMGLMFPAALRLTRNRCDAEDLIQDTFARAFVKFHQFTPGTNLRAWLHRIMFHTFYSACRKRRSRPQEALAGDLYDAIDAQAGIGLCTGSAEDQALDGLASSAVMRSLSELPECFKTVVYLADVEGYKYHEIAEKLDIPVGTVMSRIHRGRNLLRRKLLGYGPAVAPPRRQTAEVTVLDTPADSDGLQAIAA
jgi:RNA polymerase sigma-70 factor, ECF subfamily